MFMPMSVNLQNKIFLVVGGGKVATRRIFRLLEYGVSITIVSPDIDKDLKNISEKFIWKASPYDEAFLDGADFVIAATNNEALNNQIRIDSNIRKILCLDVSNGAKSDFHIPAVVQKGHIQISISTQGESPSVAKQLKTEVEEWLEEEWIERVIELAKIRKILKQKIVLQEERENLLREINALPLTEIKRRRQRYEDKDRVEGE